MCKKWKEDLKDYVDEISDGLAAALEHAAKQKLETTRGSMESRGFGGECEKRERIFKLLKRKTAGRPRPTKSLSVRSTRTDGIRCGHSNCGESGSDTVARWGYGCQVQHSKYASNN